MGSSLNIKRRFCVYCHTLREDGRRYIGITGQPPKKRWRYGSGYEVRTHFGRAIKKYGWDAFEHEILLEGLTEEEAKAKEIELIAKYQTTIPGKGFNVTFGGDGVRGYKPSQESLDKMRLSHIGKKQTKEQNERRSASLKEYYRTHKNTWTTKEHVEKMIKAREWLTPWNLGKPLSEETKQKLRIFNLGRKATEETKSKMSKSNKKRRAVIVRDMDGELVGVYSCMRDAAKSLGNGQCSHIAECCMGKRKQYLNLTWEYYEQ